MFARTLAVAGGCVALSAAIPFVVRGVGPRNDAGSSRCSSPPISEAGHDGQPPAEARKTLATAIDMFDVALCIVANNMANAATPGYKARGVVFEDLSYWHDTLPGAEDTTGQYSPNGIARGTGCQVGAVQIDFRQGRLRRTARQLDLAIDGPGFFQVLDPSGRTLYCRAGTFAVNANGNLVLSSADAGRLLQPPLTVSEDAIQIVISPEGIFSVKQPDSEQLGQAGQVELARFVNPQGLKPEGENLFSETDSSGAPILGNPGQEGMGRLRQGWLEASNVDMDEQATQWRRLMRLRNRTQSLSGEPSSPAR